MARASQFSSPSRVSLFGEVFDRVRADYVESALDGMLRELDPHSGYIDQANLDEMQRQSRGEFVGVGLEIAMMLRELDPDSGYGY